METSTRIYRRTELYEQVWAEPLRKLAPRYGVSDVALAKMCRRLGIPLPGVGHWTKIACGHRIERPPLPPTSHDQPEEVVVTPPEPRTCAAAAVTEPIPEVRVGAHLRHPHPLVAQTQLLAKDARKDEDGRFMLGHRGGLDAVVVPGSFGRAMRIMDAILKHVEGAGHHIGVTTQPPFSTYVTMANQKVAFQLRERMIRTERRATKENPYPYPRFDSQPTGILALEIKEYLAGERKRWSDGKRRPLEEQLGKFVVGLERAATYLEAQHQRFLEAEREREAERVRQAQLEERRRAEQQKLDDLMDQVSRWQQCEALRGFVAAMRAAAMNKYGTVEEGSALDAWLTWALRVADRNDPVHNVGDREEE